MPDAPISPAARQPRARALARRIAWDEKGNFLVFIGMSIAVIFGLVALSFDLGRMAAVQTDLQSFADSVALSAAAELDGNAKAIEKACAAAALVTDTQSFAAGGRDLTMADVDLVFLKTLPTDDGSADASAAIVASVADPSAANCAVVAETAQRAAAFVRVNVDPHNVEMNFASVVSVMTGGSTVTGSPTATATAGFTQFACDIPPLLFCLPQSPSGGATDLAHGQMVQLRKGGSDAAWGPGNFGFLDVSESYVDTGGACAGISGEANRIRCILGATETITRCYSIRNVTTDPGQSVGITVAPFNYRFDIYASSDRPELTDAQGDFAPAPGVIYGQQPSITVKTAGGKTNVTIDHCSPISDGVSTTDFETSMGLPRGADMTVNPSLRFGAPATFAPGTAERNAYMRLNHNWYGTGNDPFYDHKTRWAVYNEEIRRAGTGPLLPPMLDSAGQPVPLRDSNGNPVPLTDDKGDPILQDGNPVYLNARQETGRAQCYSQGAPSRQASIDPYRRVIIAAGVDCTTNTVTGRTTNLPVQSFYELFLTEPIGGDGGGDLSMYGEVIGKAGGTGSTSASSGIFRDVVQLYR